MRKMLGICLALYGVLALAGVCPAAEVKIALDSTPDLEKSGTYVWAKAFGDHLKANGMAVREFPRDALGAEEEKLDQVSQGLLEVSMSDLAKAGQLEPSIFGFNLFFVFDSMEHLDRTLQKTDLFKKVNDGTTKKGVRVLSMVAVGGFGGLSNTKKPISTPEDVPDRLRSGGLLHERQACWLDYTTGTEMVEQKELHFRPDACDASALAG